ncbi:MAG: DUF4249 domain-containing protein [Bacteroidia bacterium]
MACIDPFEVDIPFEERFLVVEGVITDQAEPYFIKLSYSSPVSSDEVITVSNAELKVESQSGSIYPFSEQETGVFVSNTLNFKGVPGESYRLLIELDGKSYASSYVLLKASPPIDNLYWEYDARVTGAGALEGVQIYVDVEDPEAKSRFYRYQWVETWKYGILYPANYIYLGNNQDQTVQAYPTCYQTKPTEGINIASTAQNSSDKLLGHPLDFVTSESNRLDKRYSVLVRQYVMEEEEFLFWKTIKESTENVGSLFDRQPQSRLGNIQNTNDPTEAVLGYFSASGVSEKRLYISRSELPLGIRIQNGFRECGATLDTLQRADAGFTQEEIDFNIATLLSQGRVFYDFADRPAISGYIFTSPECSDCRVLGGTEVKPDFWVE